MKRKRYRRLRNEAVKNNLREFSKRRASQREEREADDGKQQLMKARMMFDKFKEELGSEGRTAPQVIAAIEAFKDTIRKVVKHAYTRSTILKEINWAETKFLAAYGPKGPQQMKEWQAEAKRLRTSNRPAPDSGEGDVKPENN